MPCMLTDAIGFIITFTNLACRDLKHGQRRHTGREKPDYLGRYPDIDRSSYGDRYYHNHSVQVYGEQWLR